MIENEDIKIINTKQTITDEGGIKVYKYNKKAIKTSEGRDFISIYITKDEKNLLKDYCNEHEITMSNLTRKLIKNFLRENVENGTK